MKLLVIRHGVAEARETWAKTGESDQARPLTRSGRKLMARNARGLAALVPELDLLATSPLVRARQTAEVVANAFEEMEIQEVAALAPGSTHFALMEWIRRAAAPTALAVVGHEPDLGASASWCLAGRGAFVSLRKGGACLLELESFEPGRAMLLWSLTPRQLRRLR